MTQEQFDKVCLIELHETLICKVHTKNKCTTVKLHSFHFQIGRGEEGRQMGEEGIDELKEENVTAR